jgi:sulfofructose kinase
MKREVLVMEMDIIGIGKPCVDILSVVEKLPKPDSGSGILDFSRQGGGNVATAVVAAARLGADAGFIGLSGSCLNGKFIQEDFKYNNVDISRSVTIEGEPSDFAIILSDLETKGRSIMYKGFGMRRVETGDLDRDYLTGAKILHLEGCGEPEKTAALWMREAGKKVAYDVARYSEPVKAFTPYIDYFIASEFYYTAAFGNDGDYEKNCRAVAESGPEIVVFTLGARGCVGYSESGGFFMEEGLKVNVRDTLGAGDVYHGAILFGLAKGWTAREAAKFANAVSAIKIGYIGGRAGIPSFETADKFMKTGELDETELIQRVEYYRNKWLFG